MELSVVVTAGVISGSDSALGDSGDSQSRLNTHVWGRSSFATYLEGLMDAANVVRFAP